MIIIFVLSSINEEKLFKFSPIIFLFSLISLSLVPFIGIEVNSAQRWIDLYFLPRFQPIELVKPFLIVLISLILSNEKYENIKSSTTISQLNDLGVPCAPIHSIAKAFTEDQANSRGAVWTLSDGSPSIANALRFMSATPASPNGLIPSLDEHRDEILRDWLTE